MSWKSLRSSRIELVLTRHEQSAAFMAATHGRLTGKPGVCLTTLGPGRAQPHHRRGLCPSRRHADGHDHRPEGDHEQPAGALPDRRRRRRDEAADQDDAPDRQPAPASRPSCATPSAFAMEERPGPVHLELPEDVAGEETPDVPLVPPHPIELPVAHRGGARPCRGDDPGGRAPAGHAGRRRQPAAPATAGLASFVRRTRHSLLHHADGQGHGGRAAPTSTWARPRCPSATTSTRRSTRPT